jgi:hypothetical protein
MGMVFSATGIALNTGGRRPATSCLVRGEPG